MSLRRVSKNVMQKCRFVHIDKSAGRDFDKSLPFDGIPAPKGLPIVGTLFDIIAAGSAPKFHNYIHSRHQKLGPIFREDNGGQKTIYLSSASLMRSVFLHEGQFPKHALPESWTRYNEKHNCQRGLFFMDGDMWLENRRIMNGLVLNGDIDWMNAHVQRCCRKLVEKWRMCSRGGEFVEIPDLEKQLYQWSIDVICSLTFGNAYSQISSALKSKILIFSNEVHKIFETSSILMNFPPALAEKFNLKMWTNFETSVTDVLSLGNEIVDMFLKDHVCEDGLLFQMRQCGMSEDVMKKIFVDFITAAGDTTAFSTQWALYALSRNEKIQTRLREETCPEGNSQYLKGLIRETLRLYPVAPFVGRILPSDSVIGGYEIPKDTLAVLSLFTSGRDPAHFPDPLSFKPERWLRTSKSGELNEVLMAHGTMPFAIGKRSCIGRKLALNEMGVLIQMIAQNFDVKCLNENPVDITLRLVAVPDRPLKIGLKLR